MATFRTDPDTGRTVISEANRVDRPISDFSSSDAARTVNRFDDDPRSGGFGPPVLQDQGTGYMTRQEFENVAGMTDTNPYGRDGFFTRVFGIDPDKIDYTSNLGPRGIENVKRQAYDRFLNPFATTDAFGRPTMGADPAAGTTRSGVQPGDLTVFGPAVEAKEEGIAGLFRNTMLGSLMPKRARIPGYDANVLVPQMDLGGPQPGEGVDPQDRFPDGPPADVVRDLTATSLPTIEELTADREGRDIRRQEEQQQRTEREAQAVSAVLEMLQRATAPDAPEVDFPIGQSATGEDFPVTISDVFQPPAAFTPEQVLKANQNNATMQRADELNRGGMPLGEAIRRARLEAARAKLRTGQ